MPESKGLRVVIDTNLLISFLIGKHVGSLLELILEQKIIFLFSPELHREFFEVVRRPKFRKYFSEKKIVELQILLDARSEILYVNSIVTICRDKKDNFLLALAQEGKADYLISGDGDLLELKQHFETKIVTIREFSILEPSL